MLTALMERVLAAALIEPTDYPLSRVFAEPLDVSRWNWSALNPLNAGDFEWEYGVTPFSNWQVIVIAWAAYFVTIMAIRVRIPLLFRRADVPFLKFPPFL